MESLSKVDEPFPTPPPHFLQGIGCPSQTHSPLPVSAPPPPTPRQTFVSYETELYRSPALTTCYSCQIQVITQVTYKVGKHAWFMCFLFLLCGLVLGCFLIPFFLNDFKDAYHTCPRCQLVLYIHRKTCCA